MFQNSFIARLNLKCHIHSNNKITHICPKPTCQANCLLCSECKNEYKSHHYGHQFDLQPINNYLESISSKIKSDKKAIHKLYQTISADKRNQNLLKWQQEKQQHFQSIENHIKTLKFQIQSEIKDMIDRFSIELNKEKQTVYQQLQHYYESYKGKFTHFSELAEPVVMMSQIYDSYRSKNNLSLKLMSLEPNKTGSWLNHLKFYQNRAEMATRKETEYIKKVQELSILTNELMDELPRIKNVDYERQIPSIMKDAARNTFKAFVALRRPKPPTNQVLRSTSMNQISTHNDTSYDRSYQVNRKDQRQRGKYLF